MVVSPRSGRLVADRDRLVACATLFQTRYDIFPLFHSASRRRDFKGA